MRENTVLSKWTRGEVTFGAWLSIPSAFSAEVAAHQGFDWICIDMQHGLVDYQVAVGMLQAISTTSTIPFVRVPWNDPGIIGKVLDAGAMGVIIPMVNSLEEARAAVQACRYHPDGIRSFGPLRAGYYAGTDYFSMANSQIMCIPMIETKQAVTAIDDILSVPGINAIYVGPADLSITLGLPPRLDNGGEFDNARLHIAARCAKHNVVAGIHATSKLAAAHVEAGYRMITVSNDVSAMSSGMYRDLSSLRSADGTRPAYR